MEKNLKNSHKNEISKKGNILLNIVFLIWSFLCIYPFLLVLGISFSSQSSINLHGYSLIPSEVSAVAYNYILRKSSMIIRAYIITICVTIIGTILTVIITSLYAYPLSRNSFKYRYIFSFLIFFTMIFRGGMIANYMVYVQMLHLKNNYIVYVLPFLISGWNVFLMRTFITSSIPVDLIDAAKIDGAGEWLTYIRIVMPLCKPGLATIGLFTSITLWNDWYTPSLYIPDLDKENLQYLLYSMIANIQFLKNNIGKVNNASQLISNMPAESIRMAMCIITIAPIVFAYPFFQKYFVKGLTVGAVKG